MSASSELVARLSALGAATLGESGATPLPPGLFPVWPGARVAGPAVPVRCAAGDNLAVHAALTVARPGDVLCVVTEGDPQRGYWGEVLTVAALASGVAGLVIDAGVRDVAEIESRRFPVLSSAIALPGTSKHGPGAVGAPIELRGVRVAPGDWIVGDGDGVTVIARDAIDDVVAAADARAGKEAAMFEALGAWRTTVELLELDLSSIEITRPEPPTA
jgi:4-hydroxy-4-methyl-2-oxoglutarate aldolase